MGNVAPCLAGGPVVKVMLPDATVEKYDHPVQVADLAAMYPNYAVVHCSAAKPALGQLRAVIIMKMDEFLIPGQAYILYPISKRFNDSLRSSDGNETESNKSSGRDFGGETKTKLGSGLQEEEEEVLMPEELERNLSQTLMGPAIRKTPPKAVSPVSETKGPAVRKVPSEAACPRLDHEMEKNEKADPALQTCGWTPDLYQICED